MNYKIILYDKKTLDNSVLCFDSYDDFIFELHLFRNIDKENIKIEVNFEIIELEEYIEIIKIFYNIDKIEIDDEIKTAKDLQDWINCFSLLEEMKSKFS